MNGKGVCCIVAVFALLLQTAHAQGEFPNAFDVALLRATRSDSECGKDGEETYCAFSGDTSASLAPNCFETSCNGTCPFGVSPPTQDDLLSIGQATFIGPSRPASALPSAEISSNSSIFIPATSFSGFAGPDGFSFACWFRQNPGNTGALFSKATASGGNRILVITVSQTSVLFQYQTASLQMEELPISGLALPPNTWHHIDVTVYKEDFAFFLNGTLRRASSLSSAVQDSEGIVFLGQVAPGTDRFLGFMQDAYFASAALTQRDVQGLAGGPASYVHLAPECRCPPSHPVASSLTDCVQYAGSVVVNRGSVRRINTDAHPVGLINSGGFTSPWVSQLNRKDAEVVIDLGTLPYEMFYIFLRLSAPEPRAFIIEKSINGGQSFSPFQYYAEDCMSYFGLVNNGAITEPDGVQCETIRPLSSTFIVFRPINPSERPFSYNDSPQLRDFILATNLRLKFVDIYNSSDVTLRHLYYAVLSVTAVSRCACNGHAARCDVTMTSYTCQCLHNTMGTRCDQCLPLYNSKPWRAGITTDDFACRQCECNNHASSCHYNASLDAFPNDHQSGDGGVCNDCQHNTAGRFCETCADLYFRPPGSALDAVDVCQPCDCHLPGVTDSGDCAKSDGIPGKVAGQCNCKANVAGLRCDLCKPSFFNLTASNPNGCEACRCSREGTVQESQICNDATGQCICKQNVNGLECDQCQPGFTNLSSSNPEGCSPCGCDPVGSSDSICDPVMGHCSCKQGVAGVTCDRCEATFFNLSASGCQPCQCSSTGSTSATCNAVTGQCPCRSRMTGLRCSECGEGFYNLSAGCLPCECDPAGSINGSTACNPETGECMCKRYVTGRRCDSCISSTAELDSTNPDGCTPCQCFPRNTNTSGAELCDPASSQCLCLEGATGLSCESCIEGYYLTPDGCRSCQCRVEAAVDNICNTSNGQCTCNHEGITGETCDRCAPGYFQFPQCQMCNCSVAGSVNRTCDSADGDCLCKEFVEGDRCDACVAGFSFLEAINPSGCSAVPDEQAPPTLTLVESTTVQLTWLPPERPNGRVLYYLIHRDGAVVANATDTAYTDSNLDAFTTYLYAIEAVNRAGSVTSDALPIRTSEAPPEGIPAPQLAAINSTTVSAAWLAPDEPNGIISRYELLVVTAGGQPLDPAMLAHAGPGTQLSATVFNLQPFTDYGFVVQACTLGGCNTGPQGTVTTGEAAPDVQPPPNATTLSSTSIQITWSAPAVPNGVLTHFQVLLRESPFTGSGTVVFNVTAAERSVVVEGLSPDTEYEFAVQSFTAAGGAASGWVRARSGEDVPSGVQPPQLTVESSTSILINWTTPLAPNGGITSYTVFLTTPVSRAIVQSPATGTFLLEELTPFMEYSFLLEACTQVGCANSSSASARTMEAVPEGQAAPTATPLEPVGVSASWAPPTTPNGVIQDYVVQRRTAALTSSQQRFERGVSFAGGDYARFSSLSSLEANFMTSAFLWFKTFDTQGTLLFGASSVSSDHLAIELQDGRPVMLYDCGSGSVRIGIESDASFSDGEWHYLTAVRTGRDGNITVDGHHSASGSSPGLDQIIGRLSAIHVGGVPTDFSAPGVNGSTFAGCVRSLTYNGIQLDFSQRDSLAEDDLSISESGCLAEVEDSVHFLGGGWLATRSLFGSPDPFVQFSLEMDFRTTDPTGVIFSAAGDTATMEVTLTNQTLALTVIQNGSMQQSTAFLTICDGRWFTLSIVMQSTILRAVIMGPNAEAESELFRPDLSVSSILLNQDTYIGGSPRVRLALGMAVRRVIFNSRVVDLRNSADSSHLVDLAWSPVGGDVPVCDAGVVSFLTADTSYEDNNTDPFTTYLYRVGSRNGAGTAYSSWTGARTLEGDPSGVVQVTVVESNSTSIMVTWTPPTRPNGIILRYTITGTPLRPTWGDPNQLTTSERVSVIVEDFSSGLQAVLAALEPATVYSIVLVAETSGGRGMSPSVEGNTLEDVPAGVQPPQLLSASSTSLTLTFPLPLFPNGAVTRYEVLVDGVLTSSGSLVSQNITSLMPFTNYTIILRVCTAIGCSSSAPVVFSTLPEAPQGQGRPELFILDSRRIEAQWQPPTMPNGIITEFRLILLSGPEQTVETILYAGLDLSFIVTGLQPHSTYVFIVESHNEGGSARSGEQIGRTPEDVPEGIRPPGLLASNATALHLNWSVPETPNGFISQYQLFVLDGNLTEIFSGFQFQYLVTGLQPFTSYTFLLRVCTAIGCGSSELVTYSTREALPIGVEPPNVISTTSTSVTFEVLSVTEPNGVVVYQVIMEGLFFISNESVSDEAGRRAVFSGSEPGIGTAEDLVPFTPYNLYLFVENGAGLVASDIVNVTTLEAPPTGLSPPMVSLSNATTVRITWMAPERPNGQITHYTITLQQGNSLLTETISGDQELVMVLNGLVPFANYSASVTAYNGAGSITSQVTSFMTGETPPADFDAPVVVNQSSTTVELVWDPPGFPNGVLLSYTVLVNGSNRTVVQPPDESSMITELSPFTRYSVTVTVCNSAGCLQSPTVIATTSEGLAVGTPPPSVQVTTAGEVMITWQPPQRANGRIIAYHVERRTVGSMAVVRIGTIDGDASLLASLDLSALPFTMYAYRIVVENGAGESVGPFANFTTPQAPPEFVAAPRVTTLSSTSLNISWQPPAQPNGVLTSYILKRYRGGEPVLIVADLSPDVLHYADDGLSPFTEYSYTVTACTVGGCTESLPTNGTTDEAIADGLVTPSGIASGSASIVIAWGIPAYPNGVIRRYLLYRDELQNGNVSVLTNLSSFVLVYEGLDTSYEDVGLEPFSSYVYVYEVENAAGTAVSPTSEPVLTRAAPPLSGPSLFAEVINSSTVRAQWSPPPLDDVRGPILNYELIVTPLGLPGEALVVFRGLATSFLVTSLQPSTTYVVVVAINNGAGLGYSNNVTVTTAEGIPAGVQLPNVTAVSSVALQFAWSEPLYPNGQILLYTLYLSSVPVHNSSTEGSVVIEGLMPFTNYSYQLEACTQFGCSRSQLGIVQTPEGVPQGLAAPTVLITGATSATVSWVEPLEPNGVIVGYQVYERVQVPCDRDGVCVYVECPVTQMQCGDKCYSATEQVCCAGVLYEIQPNSVCCEANYLVSNSSLPQICCGGQLHLTQPGFQCCASQYVSVPDGSVCCETPDEMPRIGPGNACCGDSPYIQSDDVTCCGGVVTPSNANSVCCGGQVVSLLSIECCDNVAHTRLDNSVCCGREYVDQDVSLCCPLDNGGARSFIYETAAARVAANEKCCSGFLIPEEDSCCHGNSYNASVSVCADRSTTNSTGMCGTGVSCPLSQASSAFCNRCDFNAESSSCGIHTASSNTMLSDGTQCYEVTLVFNGLAFEYLAMSLTPFTEYGYSVVALNSAGNVSTGFVTAVTDEAAPSVVEQPAVSVLSSTSLFVTWVHPLTPNGVITSVSLYRNDTVIFSSLTAFSYTDGNLTAFTTYRYSLEVCTGGGCRFSPDTIAVTSADLPAGLADPVVTNRSANSITLTWSLPDAPNGVLQEFIVNETTTFGEVFRGIGLSTQLTGLMPFVAYSFLLTVCNQEGCISSNTITVRTLESPPVGVHPPTVQILTARSLDISWTQPTLTNGIILGFILRRSGEVIYNATNVTHLDTGLTPDRQYSYTVEAYNSAGGTESGPSVVRTPQDSPDGLLPPILEVLNSTAIAATWTAPVEPNGVITRYAILVNGTRQEVAGLVLEFLVFGLTPNTVYAVRVEACTVSGCATSTEATARTLQALPTGFSAPTLQVLGPTAIEVSWQPPTTPNGDIEMYEVRRMSDDLPFPTLVHVGGLNVLAFNNTGLQPFTTYQYQVRVRNGAGSTLSDVAETRTPEDIPSGISNPSILEVAATSVLVSWQQPSASNGLLLRFEVYLRLTLDPATLGPGIAQLVATTPANITNALVSFLAPATSYEVMLVVVNSAGSGDSDWIPFETAEAPPQNLQPIRLVDVPDTGMALVLAWDPPLLSNGIITAYAILVDGTEVVRGLVTTHTVMQLQPFTTYTLQLEVCTSAGCSRGEIQSATTAEVPPTGQQPPSLTVLAATIILVTWQPPLASNGNLLMCQVLRRLPAPLGSEISNEPVVVYNTSDLGSLAYNDSGLQPFTVYEYAVRSINSAGQAESVYVQVRTSQAAPEGIAAPTLTVLDSSSILVQWSSPDQINGILSGYEVIRNGSTVTPTFALSHTDTLLTPFTVYEYSILACTTAGCTLSATSNARTAEAIPTGLFNVLAIPVSSQSIQIAWSEPDFPNGVITSYAIALQPDNIQVVHTGLDNLQVEVSGLSPFTNYTVTLAACNSAGCSEERTAMVTTLEDVPQIILPPILQVLGPSSVEVTWREPAVPNGRIISYELRRNDTLIFSGAALMYIDSFLTPNTVYGYDVQAYTVAGGGSRSGVSTVRTRSDTPAGIVPPSLIPLSSSSIQATWGEPQMPNGEITEYRLLLDGTEVFRGLALQHTVTGLLPYTEYEFILSVCTTTCGFSTRVYNRTLEAAPMNIAPPNLLALPNVTVLVTWNPPLAPNGVIVSYELQRRTAGGQVTIVFQGAATSHFDSSSELLPATQYQYRVTAANSVAGVTSEFASVNTSEAPPQGVQAPEIVSVTSTSITLLIQPPLSPNGDISVYNVYRDGVLAGEVIPTDADTQAAVFTAMNLRPFTTYTFFIEACTALGCTSGPAAQFSTAEFQPLSLAPPTAFATDGRTIFLNWTAPAEPNGIITRYTLWFRTSCPQPQQFQTAAKECMVGQLTSAFSGLPVGDSLSFVFASSPASATHPLPYTSYEFLLQAENSIGAVNATMVSSIVTTPADAPEVVGGVLARVLDNDSVLVDWSGTFRLNGLLQFYRLQRNSTAVFDGLDASTVLFSEPKGQALIYTVTVMTSDGVTTLDATSPPVTVTIPVLPVMTTVPTSPMTQPGFNTTDQPGVTTTLAPGVIVAIILVCIILCTCITCGVAIVITSCILPQKEGGLRRKHKRRSTEEASSFTHQRFYDHELTEFEPRPYRTGKWSPGDPSQPGIWADQEPFPDMPPSVANETSSKRRSYSLLEAQQQYPMQQHGIAVRQSYISTAPSSSYADPKTYFYSPYEGDDDDDFYEEDEPVPCTFTDTHI